MFSKILIANRGEIAVRIIKTCREMGVLSVAVYSDADADALHVRLADEAYPLGPAPALQSYLNIPAILGAASKSGADAVHPGYGFLAENPAFASAVVQEGFVWIGPPAEVITLMGDKVRAKAVAAEAGVPTVPGYSGEDDGPDRIAEESDRIGYPVMLKAAAGGGGKGMRAVSSSQGLVAALEGAKREAAAAFGDDRIFLEKLLVRPRHIEIQVLMDAAGRAVHLGERDCSIQRRHQKVVEEAPSPVVDAARRAAMGAAAVQLARASGYVNAGTVEFLSTSQGFYFLEMNTRIQVEHPVSEAVTGVDLVRLQIEIAAGSDLPFRQEDIEIRGHAIEARIYAEDPENGFLPSTGILRVFSPPTGENVRNDAGVYAGSEITPYYDPMLAKLIVSASTRRDAVARLQDALHRYRVDGVKTNLAFLRWLTASQAFRDGEVDVNFLDRQWHSAAERLLPPEVLILASMSQILAVGINGEAAADPWRWTDGWRPFGASRTYRYLGDRTEERVIVSPQGNQCWRTKIGNHSYVVREVHASPGELHLDVDGTRVAGAVTIDEALEVTWKGDSYRLVTGLAEELTATGGSVVAGGALTAPMPGTVVKVSVEAGQTVTAHQPLLILEAMKMEHVVEAPYAGVVHEVLFSKGDLVAGGVPLVRMEPL
jgi:3-methylcrotonyl-CoA carboxylase alpha subunit